MRKTKLLSFLIVAVFIGSTFAIFLNTNMFLSKGSQLNNSASQNSQTGQKIDQKLLSPESAVVPTGQANWWNSSWTFRLNVNLTCVLNYSNRLIEYPVNFTSLLSQTSVVGGNFDNNSIRVLEWIDLTTTYNEMPSQFDPSSTYNNLTNAVGTLCWVMNGTTLPGTTRYYFIYFDILQNGAKPAPNYSTGLVVRANTPGSDYTFYNSAIKISIALANAVPGQGDTNNWFGHIYQILDERTGHDLGYWGSLYDMMDEFAGAYGGFQLAWNALANTYTTISVISNGPVRVELNVSRVVTLPTAGNNANYTISKILTLNYLDDSIRITYSILAASPINTAQTWLMYTWYEPGYGDIDNPPAFQHSALATPTYNYGLGGYNFGVNANKTTDAAGQFTTAQNLVANFTNNWAPNPVPPYNTGASAWMNPVRAAGWYSVWDQNLNQGIGTEFDNTTYTGLTTPFLSQIYGSYSAGTDGYFLFRWYMPTLATGSSFSITYNLKIFNNSPGNITQVLAPGLRTAPTIITNVPVSSGKLLTIHLADNENAPISSANVTISASLLPTQSLLSDNNGNVTFRGLVNANWALVVTYAFGKPAVSYTINSTNFNLNDASTQFYHYLNLACNLTTLNIQLVDDSFVTNPSAGALYNANVTLLNSTNGDFITNYTSNATGWVSLRVPATAYNFSIYYQLNSWTFGIDPSPANFYYSNLVDVTGALSIINVQFDILINLEKTSLSATISYNRNSTWIVNSKLSSVPYSIETFTNNIITFAMNFTDISTNKVIPGDTSNVVGGWTILNDATQLLENQSVIDPSAMWVAGQQTYNFSIFVIQLSVGTHDLYVTFGNSSIQSATYEILITVDPYLPSLVPLTVLPVYTVNYDTNLSIIFNYTRVLPQESNVTSGNLTYYLAGTNGEFTNPITINNFTSGLYNVNFNASLDANYYTLYVSGVAANYANISTQLTVEILPDPTLYAATIAYANFTITPLQMEAAAGENITIVVTYTDTNSNPLASSMISGTFDTEAIDSNFIYPIANGEYLINFPSTQYSTADGQLHSISINAQANNYMANSSSLYVTLVPYWNAQAIFVQPPSSYPWGNIATFTILYQGLDTPRIGGIAGATITQLNVTVGNGLSQTSVVLLNSSEEPTVWHWSDLGSGLYQVWFNTSIVNLNNGTTFYANPTIAASVYAPATTQLYLTISPIETRLYAFTDVNASSVITGSIPDMQLDTSTTVYVQLNVTDSASVNFGQEITNAQVSYYIEYAGNTTIFDPGTTLSCVNGEYVLPVNASRIGSYTIYISSSLLNYAPSTFAFTLTVTTKQIQKYVVSVDSGPSVSSFSTPQDIGFTISISLTDPITGGLVTGATVSTTIGGHSYKFTETSAGNYTLTLSAADLQALNQTVYQFSILVNKANYTAPPIPFSISITLPVDPYFHVPYMYWEIIISVVGAMIILYGAVKGVQNARIPIIIKQIDSTRKLIGGKKSISNEKITVSMDEDFVERYANDWRILDLDLASILHPKTGEEDKNLAPGDEK